MTDLSDSEFLQVSQVQPGEPGEALIQLQSTAFDSFEDLYHEVKAKGQAIGFRIGIRRSIRKPGNADPCAYYLECDQRSSGRAKKAKAKDLLFEKRAACGRPRLYASRHCNNEF